jgi:hypothetical protein
MIENGKVEDKMKKLPFTLVFAAFICVSCAAYVGPHGASVAIAPPLPVVVELGEPYYVYGGYHYYYHDERWYYSQSRDGRWIDLPRDRYPREVRFKGKGGEKDWKEDRRKGHGKDWKEDWGRDHGKG